MGFHKVTLFLVVASAGTPGMWCTASQYFQCLHSCSLSTSLPKTTNSKKQKWMTNDILNKMDERKAVKGRNEEHYQQLNKEISNDCSLTKENWLNKQCREIEDVERQFRTK